MKNTETCGFSVRYRLAPPWFTEEGTVEGAEKQKEHLLALGADEILTGREPPRSETMERLHHRCRRPNWEAVPYDPGEAKDILLEGQREEHPVLYFENEDLPRSVSEMGDERLYRRESASLLAAVLLTLRGDVYLWQGQELGMVNPVFTLEELQCSEAAEWLDTPEARRRSPAELEAKIGRFTCLNARTVPDFDDPEAQDTLDWYKALISFRKSSKALRFGDFCPILPEHRRALLYNRSFGDETILVTANLSAYAAEYPPELETGTLLLHNYQGQMNFPGILRPFEVKIFRK